MPNLELYYSRYCPFCIRVLEAIKTMGLKLELRDTDNPKFHQELVKGGGKQQVPCLKITKGSQAKWLYESADIVQYLRKLSS